MAVDDFNPADLDDVVAILRAIEGVRSADRDPAKVHTPGVWIRWDGLGPGTLGGLAVKATLWPVVPLTGDLVRDQGVLAALFNLIKPVIESLGGPAGDVTWSPLILPDSGAPLPAMQIPVVINTSN